MYAADNRPNQYDTRPQQMHSTKKKTTVLQFPSFKVQKWINK